MNTLTGGWKSVKLKELCREITVGFVGPMATKYAEKGIPFLRSQNIQPFRLELSSIKFISPEFHKKLKKSALYPGDVVVVRTGYPGTACVIPPKLPVSNCADLVIFRPSSQLDPHYLTYMFNSNLGRSRVAGNLVGVAQQHFNIGVAKEMVINIPPLPTQHKIASILSAYDDLIENNTRRIAILEEMAQSLYREWFVHFRFPGYEKKRLVESELGLIPEGWEVVKLSRVVETQYGYTESASESKIGPKYLRGMDINKTSYIQWDSVPYCPIDESNYAKYKLSPGDIVVIRMADPGKVGIVEKQIDAVFASYLIRLHITYKSLSPYYLFYFLLSDKYQSYVTGASTGTTRKSASAGVITDIDMIIPADDIRNLFERQISVLRQMLNNLLEKNAILRQTRDLLLPKLISGGVDVEGLSIVVGK